MPMTWQIEFLASIYNAVHEASRTVNNLGKFILNYHLHVHNLVHLYTGCNLYIKMIHKNVEILLKNNTVL